MTLKINHVNTEVMYHFGLKILFDGYLISAVNKKTKQLIINCFLFDGYLIKVKL